MAIAASLSSLAVSSCSSVRLVCSMLVRSSAPFCWMRAMLNWIARSSGRSSAAFWHASSDECSPTNDFSLLALWYHPRAR